MSINIKVVTTANRTQRFTVKDSDGVKRLLDSLRNSAGIFTGKPLIIGGVGKTEIFSSGSIVCIELESDLDLSAHLPMPQEMTITALSEKEANAPFTGGLDGEHFQAHISFFFLGGHILNTLAEGERKAALSDRLMNLTRIFERPMICYRLPQGGIGLMNPQSMTRTVITPGAPDLPTDAWVAEAL
jgi:hypothetical protein